MRGGGEKGKGRARPFSRLQRERTNASHSPREGGLRVSEGRMTALQEEAQEPHRRAASIPNPGVGGHAAEPPPSGCAASALRYGAFGVTASQRRDSAPLRPSYASAERTGSRSRKLNLPPPFRRAPYPVNCTSLRIARSTVTESSGVLAPAPSLAGWYSMRSCLAVTMTRR